MFADIFLFVNARESNPHAIVKPHISPTLQLVNSHEISKLLLRGNLTFLSQFFYFCIASKITGIRSWIYMGFTMGFTLDLHGI